MTNSSAVSALISRPAPAGPSSTVALKPSEFAPHTAAAIAQLIKATFPPDCVAAVQGERDVAEALPTLQRIYRFLRGG